MSIVCPSCGRENADDARFCSGCATELVAPPLAREERKVVTVLFCDLVGSTAQAEQLDPEDVRALLTRYHEHVRAELERFGGTVEKFIGDAVMALFGAPVAHEDDPERAVRAALAVRDWATQHGDFQVRLGVTTGEALVALAARPEAGESMAVGDVVNTAARLQSAAPRNGVLVDEITYRATARAVDYDAHDEILADGKVAPVRVWSARQARGEKTDAQAELSPFTGRARELDELVDAVERTAEEREPQLVTVVGVPGIGKTRLIWELRKRVEASGSPVTWSQGRSLPYGGGGSFSVLAEMVLELIGAAPADTSADIDAKLETLLGGVCADAGEVRWIASHLRALLGFGDADELGGDRRNEAFAAWRRFLEALAEREPLVAVFEDLHFADEALLDVVDYLAEWSAGVPLLIVGTARPELLAARSGWGGGKPSSRILRLSPLADAETAGIVSALLGEAGLQPEIAELLVARSGGNPLYAEEFARLVADGRASSDLPETVQGIIAARLDALEPEEKELIQDAAVVGQVFWLGAVGGGEPGRAVEERLHHLARKEFVRRAQRSGIAGETEYSFRHVLVRDAAYDQLPRQSRAEKHAHAAAWLASLDRADEYVQMEAHHLASALDLTRAAGGDDAELADRARPVLARAADRALSQSALVKAAELYRRAVELTSPNDPGRPRLLLGLGRALWMGAAAGEEELLVARDALGAAGDDEGVGEAIALLVDLNWHRGERAQVAEHLDQAAEVAGRLADSRTKVTLLLAVARGQLRAGEAAQGMAAARRARALADELGMDDLRVEALNTEGSSRAALLDPAGIRQLEEAANLALAIGSPEVVRTYSSLSHWARHDGDVTRAAQLADEALRQAERFGSVPFRRFVLGVMPQIRYRQGHWDEALRLADDFLDEVGDAHYFTWHALAARGLIRLARGDHRGVEDGVGSVQAAQRSVDSEVLSSAFGVHARALLLAGQSDAARRALHEALPLASGASNGFGLPYLVISAFELGEDPEIVLRVGRPGRWLDAARLYLAGDFVGAAELYREAGSPTDEAEARYRAAGALAAAGERSEAEAQLERALGFYRSVGATRYIGQAETLLTASA